MNLESGMVDAIAMDYGVAVYQMSATSMNSAFSMIRFLQNSMPSVLRKETPHFAIKYRRHY